MIKKAILFSALPAAFLFGAGALVGVQTAPAEAVIPATHAKNCFGGAVSYGTQYSLVSAGEASGQVYLEAGVNPGNSLQYNRTNVCG